MADASEPVPPPMTKEPKPEIPRDLLNPHLASMVGDQIPQVKFQVITREGQEIIVGRVKISHPNGHAFILRRFDTGAVSLTTMIRAAFPAATDDMEKSVANWVRANYSIQGANGPTSAGTRNLRLAGTWIPANLALHLAPDYGLLDIIRPLVTAEPDPGVSYRKSARSAAASPAGPTDNAPAQPVTASQPTTGGPTTRSSARQAAAPQATPTHPNKRQRTSGPTPSATTNGLTPAPAHQRTGRTLPLSPLANSPITGEDHHDEPSSATLFPTPEEDRAEAQNLISQLSKQGLKESTNRKRAISQVEPEMPTGLNPVEQPWETGTEVARVIARNRRADIANARGLGKITAALPRPATETGRKVMWGGLLFTFGVAATAFSAGIPQLFF